MPTSVEIQRELSTQLSDLLGSDAIKAYHQRSALRTVGSLIHIWISILAAFWLAGRVVELSGPYVLCLGLPLSFFMATRLNALNVVVHEGSHFALATSKWLNSILTNWGAGYWILYDEDSYRAIHSVHHRHLNETGDPDRPLYALAPSRARIVAGLIEDLLWISVAKRARVYGSLVGAGMQSIGRRRLLGHFACKLAANAVILGSLCSAFGLVPGALVYVFFWVVPLFSFYPAIIRLRIIAEHFSPEVVDPALPVHFVARTSVCGPVEHYLFGAQMDYHFEHHLFPSIPYHEARRMHAALTELGFFGAVGADERDFISGGYVSYWLRLLRSDYFRA